MKDIKKIIKKLNEVNALLEGNMNASNMDVEFMCQRLEDMIQEFEEVGEFELEEGWDDYMASVDQDDQRYEDSREGD
jgi:Asp-tRNA(Asn)/Glu-tRNA(Gln) amidotransferase C subunit